MRPLIKVQTPKVWPKKTDVGIMALPCTAHQNSQTEYKEVCKSHGIQATSDTLTTDAQTTKCVYSVDALWLGRAPSAHALTTALRKFMAISRFLYVAQITTLHFVLVFLASGEYDDLARSASRVMPNILQWCPYECYPEVAAAIPEWVWGASPFTGRVRPMIHDNQGELCYN